MKNPYILFILLAGLCYAKEDHAIQTYFRRVDKFGAIIDRKSSAFDDEIKKPLKQKISREDAVASLKVWPNRAKNGQKVTVLWSNVPTPNAKDYIAFYCPYDDNPTHYLDYFYVSESKTYAEGYGHHQVTVYNMRSQCVFKYYRSVSHYSQMVAKSELLIFETMEPLQRHIALTNDPTQMRVMWNSGEVNSQLMVKYGLTKELGMVETTIKTYHYLAEDMCHSPANTTGYWDPGFTYDALLTKLEPNTIYYYSVGCQQVMSEVLNFTTPLPAGDRTPFKFIVYGDMGVDPYPEAVTTASLVKKELNQNDIKLIFHIGDISYARGYAYIWEQWFDLVQPYSQNVPYMIGIGNHEYDHTAGGEKDPSHAKGPGGFKPSWFNGYTDSGGECSVPMNNRFHMPDNGNQIYWYSYDYGMLHMIMISTEHDYTPGSPQYTWLQNDLMNVNRNITPWVVIGGHRAMYASASIASDYVVAINMQRLFEELLYKYKIDLAFWGHYHSYERTCKVYRNNCTDDGIVHTVVGSAGFSLDAASWYPKDWSVYRIADYGYGRVTVTNTSHMLYEWVNNRFDKVMDYVWLTK